MKVTKAVIPAAGFGTRFLPATKAVPKEMLPIVDKPTIQYIVEEAIASGIEDLLIITSRGKDALVMLAKNEDMYAYDFEGRRYDIGSKQGFLQATVDFALSRDDLKDEFAEYLKEVTKNL